MSDFKTEMLQIPILSAPQTSSRINGPTSKGTGREGWIMERRIGREWNWKEVKGRRVLVPVQTPSFKILKSPMSTGATML